MSTPRWTGYPNGYSFAVEVPEPPVGSDPSGASCKTCIYLRHVGDPAKDDHRCSNPSYQKLVGTNRLGRPHAANWCCSAWSQSVIEVPVEPVVEQIAEWKADRLPSRLAELVAKHPATSRLHLRLLDLGPSDVHIPATPKRPGMKTYTYEFEGKSYECDDDEDTAEMISSDKRKSLPTTDFALPSQRKYPVDTAARTRNAAARLAQQKKAGKITDADFATARAGIKRAAKKFGIDTQLSVDDQARPRQDKPDGFPPPGVASSFRADSILLDAGMPTADGPTWIQVAKPGKFRGHSAGPFELNAQVFAEIIHNFEATQNKRVPLDFEHASEAEASSGTIPYKGAPAQGWITRLEVRADGNLWGLVEWGELARQYVRNKQYMYLSPAIAFNTKDRVTGRPAGARLSSAALTNNPFLDGMEPLAAKDDRGEVVPPAEGVVAAVREALMLPDYASAEHALAALRVVERDDVVGTAASDSRVGFRPGHFAQRLRDALRLPLTTPADEVFLSARGALGEVPEIDAPAVAPATENPNPPPANPEGENLMDPKIKELELANSELTLKLSKAEADRVTEKTAHDAELKTLRDENATLKSRVEAQDKKELDDLLDVTISVHKLDAKLRPHLENMAKNNRESFLALYPMVPAEQRRFAKLPINGGDPNPIPQQPQGGEGSGQIIDLKSVRDELPPIEAFVDKILAKAAKKGESISRETAYALAHQKRAQKALKLGAQRAGNGG